MESRNSSKKISDIVNQPDRRRIIIAGTVPGRNVSQDRNLTNTTIQPKRNNAGTNIKSGIKSKQEEQLLNRFENEEQKTSQKNQMGSSSYHFNKSIGMQQNKLQNNKRIVAIENELKNNPMQRSNPTKHSEYFNDRQDSRPLPPSEKNNSYPRHTRVVTKSTKLSNESDLAENKKKDDAENFAKSSKAYGLAEGLKPEERRAPSRNEKRELKDNEGVVNGAIKRHSLKDAKGIDSEKAIFIIHRQHDKTTPSESSQKHENKISSTSDPKQNSTVKSSAFISQQTEKSDSRFTYSSTGSDNNKSTKLEQEKKNQIESYQQAESNITQSEKKDNATTSDSRQYSFIKSNVLASQPVEKATEKTTGTSLTAENTKSNKISDPSVDEAEKKVSTTTVKTMTNDKGGQSYVYETPYSSQSSSTYSKLTTFNTSNFSSKKDAVSTKDDDDNDNDNKYSSKNYSSSSEPYGLVGLRNIGNTCFMNSTLQCLFNLKGFTDYFLKGNYQKDLQPKEKGLAEQFAELLKKIRSHRGGPSSSGESTYSLKRAIEKVSSTFSGYDQQDAQELLKAVLEGINEDCNRIDKKPPYKELKIDDNRSKQENSDEWFNYNLARDNSIVTDYFCGQLMSKIICNTCNYESLSFDNFWDLSLSFTRGLGMLDSCELERMFEHFLKEEQLEDLFTCEKCKTKRKSNKKFVIWRVPKILVIHLKRFHYGKTRREKIRQNVIFPVEGLNLKQFIEDPVDPSTKDPIYDLVGIVNHSGDLYGGHYTSECMNPFDRKWYNFNDDYVREVGNGIIKRYASTGGASPYILFYCKRSLLK